MPNRILTATFIVTGLAFLPACGKDDPKPTGGAHVHADGSTHSDHGSKPAGGTHKHADGSTHTDHGSGSTKPRASGTHVHADGSTHTDHAQDDGGHAHEEVELGGFDIQGIKISAAQGHGKVKPGKESHLVLKLPYKDNGATSVRAWIGTEDRTLSMVGKGGYTPSRDVYDIHAVAPDPLPEGAKWWIEIEKPDGTKKVGSFAYLAD